MKQLQLSSSLIMYFCFTVVHCVKTGKDPMITPETYVDNGKPFLEFSCEAYLEKGDRLSWSITRDKKEETIASYEELEESKRTKTLDLNYPLALEDNNAEIVCVAKDKSGTKRLSKKVLIIFETAKIPETREKVFVWPKKNYLGYDDTMPVQLTCWAFLNATDKANDTNLYVTWYQIYGSSRPEIITMLPQENKYGYVKLDMVNVFTPVIDDGTRIYCATELMSTSLVTTPKLESEQITLLFFPPADVCYPSNECKNVATLGWAVAAVLAVLAVLMLVGLLMAIISLCCRGDRECESNETQKIANKF